MLRRIFGPEREDVMGGGENFKTRNFHQISPE
jgi:hypothetical protein